MSNLLDKASIILTPTAYNNGEALCVKPSDGSGDFDFSRNSAATRVNAQGLVENVQILSSNLVQNGDFSEEGAEEVSNGSFSQEGVQLVTNGDFSNGLNNWSVVGGSYASVNNGILNSNNTVNGSWFGQYIAQDVSFVNGKTYKITFKAKNISGNLNLRLTQGANVIVNYNLTSEFVSYTYYYTSNADNGSLRMFCNDAVGQFEIDNVSVREVGQDWILGTNWSIGEDKAISDGTSGNLYQSGIIVTGKQYKIQATVSDYVSGNVQVSAGAVPRGTMSANGTYTFYQTASSTSNFFLISNIFNGSITNISVKEVGQNWEFNSTAILTANGMNITTGGYIRQDVVTIGKSYKLTYDIVSYTSGNIRVYDGTSQGSIPTSVGSNTFNFTAGGSVFVIQSNSASVNLVITNISVIEITTDTSLPRINYEGFSYQDALGSELVVNGTFDDGLNGWSAHSGSILELENGMAKVTTSNNSGWIKRTDLPIENGKTYFCKADITNAISKTWYINGTSDTVPLTLISGNTYGGYVTITGNNPTFYIKGNQTNGEITYIDNVSVKEYLGQSVVPESGCGSWLFEPQSTNLITYSEDFSNSSWIKQSGSIGDNQAISPDGTLNADKLIDGATNGVLRREGISLSALDYTFSVFAKKDDRDYLLLITSFGIGTFDLNNGVVVSSTLSSIGKIEEYTNGWYKCSLTFTATASSPFFRISTSGSQSIIIGVSGIYIWGAMLEQQSYATSYIPTEGSSVTRNQDVCTNGGSVSTINSTEGVLYAEVAAFSNSDTFYIGLFGGSLSRVRLAFSPNRIRGELYDGAFQGIVESFINISNNNKVAFKYKENDFALWINGVEVDTDNSGLTFSSNTLTYFNLSGVQGNIFNINGKTKCLAVWKEALSDEELTLLTTI